MSLIHIIFLTLMEMRCRRIRKSNAFCLVFLFTFSLYFHFSSVHPSLPQWVPRESLVPNSISKSTRFLPFLSSHLPLQTNLESAQPFSAHRSDRSLFPLQLPLFLSLKGIGRETEQFLGTRPSLALRPLCCAFVLGLLSGLAESLVPRW